VLGAKLSLAGHSVQFVCLEEEADLINREGISVRYPIGNAGCGTVELNSVALPGSVSAALPTEVNPQGFDLVILAMQEPQYGSPDLKSLLASIAARRLPCVSIMNMPPLPFLARVSDVGVDAFADCYTHPDVWERFDPELVTHSAADAQATRVQGGCLNSIEVRLPSNFKVAGFSDNRHDQALRELSASIAESRWSGSGSAIDVPVKLRVHESPYIPLSKWPMLITGNYRAITATGARSIDEAVHDDLDASREVYEEVQRICKAFGAGRRVLVPFRMYATAAHRLRAPSSAARAIAAGAVRIERVDRLVQRIGRQVGASVCALDEIVDLVDRRLAENRASQCADA
jgi:hypothetical protein